MWRVLSSSFDWALGFTSTCWTKASLCSPFAFAFTFKRWLNGKSIRVRIVFAFCLALSCLVLPSSQVQKWQIPLSFVVAVLVLALLVFGLLGLWTWYRWMYWHKQRRRQRRRRRNLRQWQNRHHLWRRRRHWQRVQITRRSRPSTYGIEWRGRTLCCIVLSCRVVGVSCDWHASVLCCNV